MSKLFFIVKDKPDIITGQLMPFTVAQQTPLLLGRPIIKMSPLVGSHTLVPIKIRSPKVNVKLMVPFRYTRSIVDDIYRYNLVEGTPYDIQKQVVFTIDSPNIHSSINSTYSTLFKIIKDIISKYNNGAYIEDYHNGSRIDFRTLSDMLQKLIDRRMLDQM